MAGNSLTLAPAPRSEAAEQVRAEVREFLAAELAAGTFRTHVDTWLSGVDPTFSRKLGERGWLGIDKAAFYDEAMVAIVPMGLCYPGRGASGDLPPRPECRATWHPRLLPLLPGVRLVLAIGAYAQAHFLGDRRKKTLTDTVKAWREYAPAVFPLPHPSPRNTGWFVHNPWFDAEVVPALRAAVGARLGTTR